MKTVSFGISKKIQLLNVVLVLASALVLGAVFYSEAEKLILKNKLEELSESVSVYRSGFQQKLKSIEGDTLFLSQVPPIQGIIRTQKNNGKDPLDGSSNEEWEARLASIFTKFLKDKPNYIQLRYIGVQDNGREIVRVDKVGTSINVIKNKNLQAKGERPYVKDTIALTQNQLYLSEISLNREHGKIALPHTPVLRAATPIYDEDANIYGVVVANIDATQLIHEGMPIKYPILVVNQDGYYLSHPHTDKTFGHDLGQEWKIQNDFAETKTFFDPGNIFQKATFISDKVAEPIVLHIQRLKYDPLNPDHNIGLVVYKDLNALMAGEANALYKIGFLLVMIILTVLVLTYYFSRRMLRPLDRLIQASEDLALGKAIIDYPKESKDEFGVLAESLESMNEKVKERAIAEASDRQSATIMENMVDAVITIDDNGKVLAFNSASERLFSYTRDEVVGRNVSKLMPEPYKSEHDDYVSNYLQTGNKKIIGMGREVVGLRKNGSTFPMELAVSEMWMPDSKGQNRKTFVGSCKNIEERKQNEEKIVKAREEAEKANRAKSEFLARMSHELRTPLNAILGFSQLEMMRFQSRGDEEAEIQSRNIKMIYDSGNHLLELVNEVLDLSRIESGIMSFSKEAIDVVSLLSEVYSQTVPLGAGNSVSVELEIPRDIEKVFVYADRTRLKQVVLNLVSNGIKYNREKGETVTSLLITSDGRVRMSVKDQGRGIAANQIHKLFKPFERLGAEGTEVEGTGIGLSIAKQLTEDMGGVLGYQTVENEGSLFYVEFDSCPAPEELIVDQEEALKFSVELNRALERELQILYIEDSPANMELMSKWFSQQENIKLLQARDPKQGIELARAEIPDLILLDIHLPGMDGYEVFEILSRDTGTKAIPIIALSANAMQTDIDKALKLGFKAYIVKPFKIEHLCKEINRVLGVK